MYLNMEINKTNCGKFKNSVNVCMQFPENLII